MKIYERGHLVKTQRKTTKYRSRMTMKRKKYDKDT